MNEAQHAVQDILAEVLAQDRAGRHQQAVDGLLRKSTHPALLEAALTYLLHHYRFVGAGLLGQTMLWAGIDDPTAHLACAISGMIAGDKEQETRGIKELARTVDLLGPEEQAAFYAKAVNPVLSEIAQHVHRTRTETEVLRVLEILKAGAPRFRRMFDWSASAACGPRERQGRSGLITYRSPPADAPRTPRRVVVAMREKMFPERPDSRLFEVGPRFVDAARRYGWESSWCPMGYMDLEVDSEAIYNHCLSVAADVLIFDDHVIVQERNHLTRLVFIATLRQALPAIKIVGLHLDSWKIPPDFLRQSVPMLDAIWAVTPSMPHWREPLFAGKVLQAPIVHSGDMRPPDDTVPNRISFVGGLMGYNWHRIFWQAASIRAGLPIDWRLTEHTSDNLPPLESYAGYLSRLAATGVSLNMAMRQDLSCVITDRSFEAPLVGTLLVQEESPDMDYFFVEGQHYLGFSSFADLRRIADMVANQPETVQAVRRAGHAFAVERYADEKLIGYLDALLFYPS